MTVTQRNAEELARKRAWEDLMKNAPDQESVEYDLAGITRYLNKFESEAGRISGRDPSDLSVSGRSSWLGVNYGDVDATEGAQQSLQYNVNNMSQFARMAGQSTEADTRNRMNQMDQVTPNWRNERDQASILNQSWMKGEVGKDVQDQLQRNNAFTNIMAGGYGGAGNARAATARDLGLTSFDLQSKGQDSAMKWQDMLTKLLPQATSTAAVMESQGLSPSEVIKTQLTNAQNRLAASEANASGLQSSAEFNIDANLRSKGLQAESRLGYDTLAMESAFRTAEMGTTAIQNKYAADRENANILFGNLYRPWAMDTERQGNTWGMNASGNYGI